MSARTRRPVAAALATGIARPACCSRPRRPGVRRPARRERGASGVTATSIKVAGLGDSFLYGGADIGAKARFQRANDAGGVHGRTIDYAGFTDDGGDPTAGTTAATKLVQQDQVFAVVPAVTPAFAAGTFLAQQKVPYFGWAPLVRLLWQRLRVRVQWLPGAGGRDQQRVGCADQQGVRRAVGAGAPRRSSPRARRPGSTSSPRSLPASPAPS